MNPLDTFLFGIYPYICMAVFLLGSLLRFDRDQYSWKSDSSQMLRAGTLRWNGQDHAVKLAPQAVTLLR